MPKCEIFNIGDVSKASLLGNISNGIPMERKFTRHEILRKLKILFVSAKSLHSNSILQMWKYIREQILGKLQNTSVKV